MRVWIWEESFVIVEVEGPMREARELVREGKRISSRREISMLWKLRRREAVWWGAAHVR